MLVVLEPLVKNNLEYGKGNAYKTAITLKIMENFEIIRD
jgi:hypothetical protein